MKQNNGQCESLLLPVYPPGLSSSTGPAMKRSIWVGRDRAAVSRRRSTRIAVPCFYGRNAVWEIMPLPSVKFGRYRLSVPFSATMDERARYGFLVIAIVLTTLREHRADGKLHCGVLRRRAAVRGTEQTPVLWFDWRGRTIARLWSRVHSGADELSSVIVAFRVKWVGSSRKASTCPYVCDTRSVRGDLSNWFTSSRLVTWTAGAFGV